MSLRMSSSFCLSSQSIDSTGKPHLSFLFGSNEILFSWYGKISPNPVAPMVQEPGSVRASLNAAPIESSATSLLQPCLPAPP